MFDSHIHTKFSTDSDMNIDEAINSANKKNIKLIITEHMDLGFKSENKFCFNVDDYFKEYLKYRNENLLLGIELGMEKDLIDEGKSIIDNYDFDFVLGSIHLINKKDLYFEDFYKDKTKKEAYSIYFENMIYNLKMYDFIDSLAHIDYISRYARYPDKEIYYDDFKDYIDEVLKILVEKEKSIEINTRRLNDKNAINNLIKIYKEFKSLGGKTVTIGSDSHNPNDIGNNFKLAREIADFCNLKIVYYKKRKPVYDK